MAEDELSAAAKNLYTLCSAPAPKFLILAPDVRVANACLRLNIKSPIEQYLHVQNEQIESPSVCIRSSRDKCSLGYITNN